MIETSINVPFTNNLQFTYSFEALTIKSMDIDPPGKASCPLTINNTQCMMILGAHSYLS